VAFINLGLFQQQFAAMSVLAHPAKGMSASDRAALPLVPSIVDSSLLPFVMPAKRLGMTDNRRLAKSDSSRAEALVERGAKKYQPERDQSAAGILGSRLSSIRDIHGVCPILAPFR
jgi:hypothetical protein